MTNALSPAQILGVELNDEEEIATVIVPDKQLSLAIGKEGQNARLAAKLSGWRIDIKSASVAEAEKTEKAKPSAKAKEKEEAITEEAAPAEIEAILEPVPLPDEEPAVEAAEPAPAPEETLTPQPVIFEPQPVEDKPQLRFAEDISGLAPAKPGAKSKKKKKKGVRSRESAEDGIKLKKLPRTTEFSIEEEEED